MVPPHDKRIWPPWWNSVIVSRRQAADAATHDDQVVFFVQVHRVRKPFAFPRQRVGRLERARVGAAHSGKHRRVIRAGCLQGFRDFIRQYTAAKGKAQRCQGEVVDEITPRNITGHAQLMIGFGHDFLPGFDYFGG
jgi:hypothetical protein